MRLTFAIFSIVLCCSGEGLPVWIDTDPSVAPGGHEIDDGLAMLQAFGSSELSIRGVSIVFGNASLPAADRIGREIVAKFGPCDLPVHTGAGSAGELGRETDASRALASALRREPLTVLVLGPATNIATLLKRHPDLAARIVEIVAVAGRRPGQRFTARPEGVRAFRDLNFELDPAAFQVLLDANVKLTFAPWEISSNVWLRRGDLDRIAAPGVSWIKPAAIDWIKLWNSQFGVDGFNPFDTLAVGYLTDPETLSCSELGMQMEHGPDDTKAAPAPEKPYLIVRDQEGGRRVKYCHTATPEFKRRLLRRLGTTSRGCPR